MSDNVNSDQFSEIYLRNEKKYSIIEKALTVVIFIIYFIIRFKFDNSEVEGWALLLLLVFYLSIMYLSFPKCPRCDSRIIFLKKELISYCNNCGIKLKN